MAAEKEESKLPPFGAVVTIALAASAYFLIQEPLKSSRPTGVKGDTATTGMELIDARLWQDPFEAVAAHKRILKDLSEKEVKDDTETLQLTHEHPLAQVWDKAPTATVQNNQVTILLVLTDPSPYVEGTEARIRDRYAVVSALQARCYTPNDAEHLRFYTRRTTTNDPSPRFIPFEWFQKDPLGTCGNNAEPNAVLVIWLMDEPARGMLLPKIHEIAKEIKDSDGRNILARLTFKIIGPRSTTSWIEWLKDDTSLDWSDVLLNNDSRNKTIEVFSPWATTDPRLIGYALAMHASDNSVDGLRKSSSKLESSRTKRGLDVKYEIPDDHIVLDAMVDELEQRQIDPANDPIVLIGEWDTFYGKALSTTFRDSVVSKKGLRCKSPGQPLAQLSQFAYWAVLNIDACPRNIKHYSYLRGLDGFVAEDRNESSQARSKEKPKRDDEHSASRSIEFLERAENTSQFDYLRRLAKRIQTENPPRNAWGTKPKPGVSAIGILGTDSYDELLILQALRPAFPDAVFFVTDLDARLLHPTETKWARNTIAASAFPLQLDPGVQRDIPPFRSSYQTSTFAAVYQAMGGTFEKQPQPVLYEIGRQDFVSLRIPQKEPSAPNESNKIPRLGILLAALGLVSMALAFASRHVLRSVVELWQPWMALTLFVPTLLWGWGGILGGTVLYVALYRGIQYLQADLKFQKNSVWLSGIMSKARVLLRQPANLLRQHEMFWFLLVGGLVWMVATWPTGIPDEATLEPFSFLNGMSIWPSLLLMLLTFWLSVFLCYKARYKIHQQSIESPNEFGLTDPKSEECNVWKTVRSILLSNDAKTPEEAWTSYRTLTLRWPSFFAIMFLILGVFFLFGVVVWLYHQLVHYPHIPVPPCRGLTCAIFEAVLGITLLAFYGLNFYVFHTVGMCAVWVQNVSECMHPGDALPDFKKKLHGIGMHTTAIDSLFTYPLVPFSLFVLAQSSLLDRWYWPVPLISWLIVMGLCIIASAVLLKKAAEDARKKAIWCLDRSLYNKKGELSSQSDEIRNTIEDIQDMRVGAFASLWQHPIVTYGSIAALAIAQHFAFQ